MTESVELSPDFRVEPADYTADFKDLRAVREPVFVVEQNVPLELEWDDLDPLCHHVIARDAQHRPIGTGRLTPEHKIGRLAVLREWRGKGVGDALLGALIDQARRFAWPEVSLHAQVDAIDRGRATEALAQRHQFDIRSPGHPLIPGPASMTSNDARSVPAPARALLCRARACLLCSSLPMRSVACATTTV